MSLIHPPMAAVIVATSLAAALADPPRDRAMTITEIVEHLEQQGYGPFLEVSYDDGRWEIEAYRNDAPRELTVDRQNGEILSEHADDGGTRPPHDAKALSQILRGLSQAGYSGIDDVSFERRYWEVELIRDNVEHELHVDPRTGEVVSDRIDD